MTSSILATKAFHPNAMTSSIEQFDLQKMSAYCCSCFDFNPNASFLAKGYNIISNNVNMSRLDRIQSIPVFMASAINNVGNCITQQYS